MVVGQIGQSLDGRIATESGHSKYINGPAGLTHLHRLRALVDAVVIGVGTAIADDPQLTVRRVSGQQPARVVIDPKGRLLVKNLYDQVAWYQAQGMVARDADMTKMLDLSFVKDHLDPVKK